MLDTTTLSMTAAALAPAAAMSAAALWPDAASTASVWARFHRLAAGALLATLLTAALAWAMPPAASASIPGWLAYGTLGAWMAVLVQFLGWTIGAFSARYLEGEAGQARYVRALAAVLAAVHLLLLADHWAVLIAAWAAVGIALQRLLCFYPDRPFARLAAHKKRLADRSADALLVGAAALAWFEVGSGSLSALRAHLAAGDAGWPLQTAAVLLVLAVILRTALLPVHGWLIQVMEAPTPVSALLHAGVVNLGGFVLIGFAPLLEASTAARWLLVAFGLGTAVLAGLVMLTRISIKVRLAWSTVAQMGFMLLECGLGLYTLAALHLIGHSLYKAHAFLSASEAVRTSRIAALRPAVPVARASLFAAPVVAAALVAGLQGVVPWADWPVWWSAILALAWAPLLWLPTGGEGGARVALTQALAGAAALAVLTVLAGVAHALPFGIEDRPDDAAGIAALIGMGLMYLALARLQSASGNNDLWRRWAYAGFYVDEFTTRLTLRLWPTDWAATRAAPPAARTGRMPATASR